MYPSSSSVRATASELLDDTLQYTTMSGGVRFGLIVHHTDAVREYAYDRKSDFGRLDKALDAAAINNWTVVNMKNDWKRVFAFD